ncbi:CusA/CzcA family heavy metal efflux RND transporter [Ralstonia insidiosa]|jgi:cobalt-zinc-cadmium resistance protein CzcA|uniref:efflux RND transporter permease subunit n=1 Tax=Ralstonia TaxID=48736 RepID=UPI000664AB37|nr:CusA/CzcA family heavy metal efflux RND transporter [Ralstonia insidiosa]KMW48383.1 membrane protein [Ralstonia sp. MD27]MBX3770863.1 CusA/CzcA family heavy metal efflux RND transporter [Ralstonia pickettii]NOZ98450.1 efflux RND transporter permease subunit [Betaproteobacteria bacterium]MBA9855021.1 efflux RND transporter permease subunit [Ralstonia insidiosa]MBA9872116.1 efflux RND transporter permease subunit [Ralstonia insidiosa]
MIERLVTLCFNRRGIVVLVFLMAALYGWYSWKQLPLEAYPDIADTSSQVVTQVNGLAAEEVEQQITIPLERAIMGTPGMHVMRSKSTFGLSLITVVFQDGAEDYWSRQRLQESINGVDLPYGAKPGMDPLTSPIGEIYRYTLESKTRDLRELSELQFWKVIPRLKQVAGVVDVANFGGLTTQFMLEFDPAKMTKYSVSLSQISQAIQANNANAGGSIMQRGEQGLVVRGVGLIRNLEDLGNVVVSQKGGVPVLIKDIGQVMLGNHERNGILGRDGNPDTIQGITLLLRGQNPSVVMKGVHEAVRDLNEHILPKDVKVVAYIDRSKLVEATVHTVGKTLIEGMVLVSLVLLLFLGSPRAALIVAVTIPFSLLAAFILMHHFKIPANLLSLGAIDFGIIVDGAIVMMENILRKREEEEGRELDGADIMAAARQVTRPIFFGMVVIIVAYLPLFAFQRIEYKLFSPMAFAVGFALFGALLVALLLVPGLAYWAYRKPAKVFHNPVLQWLTPRYEGLLNRVVGKSRAMIGLAVATLAGVVILGASIGRDFLPYLDEGSIWLQVTLPPGISLDKASEMAGKLREAAREFPEVEHIVTQVGRNDEGTDPFSPSHIESAVTLHPYSEWKTGRDKQELIAKMAERFQQLPGIQVGFSQPMIDGVLDKLAGAHSDLVVKVYGNDFAQTRQLTTSIERLLKTVPGAQDVIIDQEPPLPQVRIDVDRAAAARLGINIADVMDLIQTGIGGSPVTKVFVEDRSYDVAARFVGTSRNNPEAIGNLTLTTANGAHIALAQIAKVGFAEGETTITREMNKRHLTVRLNLRGRDLASFLDEAKQRIDQEIQYDHTRNQIAWGGQFENQQRAQARLALILPMVLALMFVLLFAEFKNLRQPALILCAVPLATLGGLVALHLRGMTLNVSSAVGFIALFGVAVLNAIIMISNLNRWRRQPGIGLKDAVVCGARERMRPVLMTATVAALGLIPAALAHGLGSDVQRPLATVVVGGLVSATVLTLVLLPALYYLIEERAARRKRPEGPVAYVATEGES